MNHLTFCIQRRERRVSKLAIAFQGAGPYFSQPKSTGFQSHWSSDMLLGSILFPVLSTSRIEADTKPWKLTKSTLGVNWRLLMVPTELDGNFHRWSLSMYSWIPDKTTHFQAINLLLPIASCNLRHSSLKVSLLSSLNWTGLETGYVDAIPISLGIRNFKSWKTPSRLPLGWGIRELPEAQMGRPRVSRKSHISHRIDPGKTSLCRACAANIPPTVSALKFQVSLNELGFIGIGEINLQANWGKSSACFCKPRRCLLLPFGTPSCTIRQIDQSDGLFRSFWKMWLYTTKIKEKKTEKSKPI